MIGYDEQLKDGYVIHYCGVAWWSVPDEDPVREQPYITCLNVAVQDFRHTWTSVVRVCSHHHLEAH